MAFAEEEWLSPVPLVQHPACCWVQNLIKAGEVEASFNYFSSPCSGWLQSAQLENHVAVLSQPHSKSKPSILTTHTVQIFGITTLSSPFVSFASSSIILLSFGTFPCIDTFSPPFLRSHQLLKLGIRAACNGWKSLR